MKFHSLICSIVILLFSFSQLRSQGNTTFENQEGLEQPKLNSTYNKSIVDPSKEWFKIESGNFETKFSRLKFAIDSTMIGDYFYHNLIVSEDSTGQTYKSSGKFGRNEGSRFWMLDSLSNTEYLINDMSLLVGDKFKMRLGSNISDNPEFRVLTRDSLIIKDGSKRLRLGLSCSSNNFPEKYWVEGIGHITGIFETQKLCHVDVPIHFVTCYFENGEHIYQSDEFSCWETTSIEPVSIQKLNIYPNPGFDKINIVIDQKMQLPLKYQIISSSGHHIIKGSHFSQEDLSIDVQQLHNGFYFINMRDQSGKMWSGKWIKN